MKVVLFGATGMVGRGVLLEALDDPAVEHVLAIVRKRALAPHPKLTEAVVGDFTDLRGIAPQLAGHDACFYCLGVSAVGMSEEEYTRVTYDYAVAAAKAMVEASPGSVFVYVSGAGTDSTEKGRTMWARVKGRTENAIFAMPFGAAYAFRPGFIRPERGITSKTRLYRAIYALTKPFAGAMVRSGSATTTSRVGQAMLELAERRPKERLIEQKDINRLASERLTRRSASG